MDGDRSEVFYSRSLVWKLYSQIWAPSRNGQSVHHLMTANKKITFHSAIQLSWLCIAYPCLLLAYIGQAAYISDKPEAYSNPFFNAAPPGTFWPSLIISILAAIVASQALITSTFQLLFQVVNMSYFPPISMRHTSRTHHTQVYIPMANWLLMIGTIAVTAAFKNVCLLT
jgi:KUP system potassium uptake protein